MTSPFTDEELRQLAKTRKNTDVPAQWISALARELLQLRQQITPQAGAEPFGFYSEETDTFFLREYTPVMPANTLLLYRTAPPSPVCPHIRSSKDGTSWCDLAARVGDLSPVAPVWQPIETAPRDGDGFLACDDNYDCVEWLKWDGDLLFNVNSKNYTRPDVWKYWRPLPLPPDSPGAGDL